MSDAIAFPDLERLFDPRSVILVGASAREGSIGRIALDNIARYSAFSGDLYLVNPTRASIDGRKAYPCVAAIPGEGFDVALVVVPAAQVLEVLEACAEKRVRFAVVITSGFAELGAAGAEAEARMRALAHSSGMRIYGPNCPGLTNVNRRIGLNISPSFRTDTTAGPIGLVTQGGGLGRAVIQASDRGFGIGLWGSPGNEADLQVADLVHYMVCEPSVRVLAVIVEGFKSGERFVAAAEAAARAGKPIVLLKMGRSPYGVAAAQSHTAAMAGEDEVNDAVFRQYGIIRVDDLAELHETAALLARNSGPAPQSVCVTSFSGGAAAYAADILGAEGLSLAELSSDTRRELAASAPGFISIGNPVDLTTAIFSDGNLHQRALDVLLRDGGIDAVLAAIPADYGDHTHRLAEDLLAAQAATQKLIVPVWMSERRGSGYVLLEKGGLLPFRSMTAAARTLRRISDYSSWARSRASSTARPKPEPVPFSVPEPLDEVGAKAWLELYGIEFPQGGIATSAPQAASIAERIGRPVVLKIVSPDIAHKSDVGGVEIGVRSPEEAAAAYSRILERVGSAHRQARISGVLITEMISDGIEVLLGVHHDAAFGPILTIGFGGVLVEVLHDVAHVRLPASREDIRCAIDRLRGRRLLDGVRGRPAADVDALLNVAESFAAFAFAERGRVLEAEINPLIVRPSALGAFAADALIRTK